MKPFFLCTMGLWSIVAAYHLGRWRRRGKPLSLAAAVYPAGWLCFSAREAHLIPLEWAHVMSAGTLVLGVLCATACVTSWWLETAEWRADRLLRAAQWLAKVVERAREWWQR